MKLKKVFLGYANEAKWCAEAVLHGLSYESDLQVDSWNTEPWKSMSLNAAVLEDKLSKFDYATFLLMGDDRLRRRQKEGFCPRDNVIFEAGLFIGRLGLDRVFLLAERRADLLLPSDWNGLNPIPFDRPGDDTLGAWKRAVTPAIIQLKNEIRLHYEEASST